MKFKPLPTGAPGMRAWFLDSRRRVAAASPDPEGAARWFDKCKQAGVTLEDLADSEGRDTLDCKISSGLSQHTGSGELGLKIANFEESLIAGGGKHALLKGRQQTLLIIQHFESDAKKGALYNISDLQNVAYTNDAEAGIFIQKFTMVRAGMKRQPQEDDLEVILEKQLRKSVARRIAP